MVGSKCVRYESGPCGILYASRTNLYVCLLALSLSQVWAHGASFDFFISFSLSLSFSSSILLQAYHESVSPWSLYRVRIHAIPFLRVRMVSQDLFAPRWLPTKLVRNTSGSHSSNDKRHRAIGSMVSGLLLFFGFSECSRYTRLLYIYIYIC